MTRTRQMVGMDYQVPESWSIIPTTPDESNWERHVAEELCDGEQDREVLADRLRRTHRTLISEPRQDLAVWVPDRDIPEVAGLLLVDLVVGDHRQRELSRAFYRSLLEPDRRMGCTVFNRRIDDVELPAGPALAVREIVRQHQPAESDEAEIVEEHTIYTVFPDGCMDALEFLFWTPSLEVGEEMAADAAAILKTLSVDLGEVSAL